MPSTGDLVTNPTRQELGDRVGSLPQAQGLLRPLQASAERVAANKKELMKRAGGAILQAIREYNTEHPREK